MCRAPDISVKKKSLRIKQYLNRFLAHFCAFVMHPDLQTLLRCHLLAFHSVYARQLHEGSRTSAMPPSSRALAHAGEGCSNPGQMNLSASSCRIPCLKNNDGQLPQRRPGGSIGSVC